MEQESNIAASQGATRGKKRGLAITALALAAALGLSACGGGASSDESNGSGDEGASTETTVATVAQGVDPTIMDPVNQRETTTVNVLQHFYDPLLKRDKENAGQYLPALATEWELVDDTTWEFKLRDDVTFSDGSPFTSADVVWTVDYVLGKHSDAEPLLRANFVNLESAEAVDEYTVRLTSTGPDPLLMPRLPGMFMLKADTDLELLATEPLGTGPYVLDQWDRNAAVTMSAREDYWGGKAAIDQVVFRTIPDASARLASLNSGAADVITNLSPDNIPEIEAAGLAHIADTPSVRTVSVWLNTLEEGPLQDARVRNALNYAIDKPTMIETVMSGYGRGIAAFTPDFFVGHVAENEPLPYDPERAKELMKEAGYEDGFDMTMMLAAGRMPFGEEVAQTVQAYLGEIGVNVTLDIVEFGVFADRTQSAEVDEAYMAGYGNNSYNPLAAYQVVVRTGDSGFALYSNEEVDNLIDTAAVTVDPEEHNKLLAEIEGILLEETPFIFLYSQVDLYGVSDRLNWEPSSDEMIWLYEASINE